MAAGFVVLLGCKGGHNGNPQPTPDGSIHVEVSDGAVRITPELAECPALILSASPQATSVDGQISVAGRATGGNPAARFTYHWTASAGTFADASASVTTFRCPGANRAGPAVLTLAVSDGKCSVTRAVTVSCFGFADAGVQTDGGGDDRPSGAGGAGGGPQTGGTGGVAGGSGAGGAGGSCAGDPSACEGELCNQCTFGVPTGAPDLCSDTPSTCGNCFGGTKGTDGCAGLASDADRVKCWALYVCIRDGHCVDGDTGSIPCWCGHARPDDCIGAGSGPGADGPCLQQFIDAAKSSDPGTINLHFIDPLLPIGRAVNLAACRWNFCGKYADSTNPSCPLW